MRKIKIFYLIHDDDLMDVLENLGVLSDVKRKKRRCSFCLEILSLANIGALYPEDNDVKIACNNPMCLTRVAAIRSRQRADSKPNPKPIPIREPEEPAAESMLAANGK